MPLVYKVDNPVKSPLLSSLVLPNTRLPLNPTLRIWSYNRYLNEWTVKNNYLLLLILDVIENIRIKKIFTKIDLR